MERERTPEIREISGSFARHQFFHEARSCHEIRSDATGDSDPESPREHEE